MSVGDLFASLEPFVVRAVRQSEVRALISTHHYLGGVGSSAACYGAFSFGVLIGCVIFQTPCSENVRRSVFGAEYKQNVTELSRLCLIPDCPEPASKIVSESIKVMQRDRARRGLTPIYGIISFADTNAGHHGGVYQSMSWLYCGTSKTSASVQYIDQEGKTRHRRQCGVNITKERALERGWRVVNIKSAVKHRYLKILGSKKLKRRLTRALKLNTQPYPKPRNDT